MDRISDIEECEEQLRAAMLTGDVAQLDRLLSDEAIFTNQDGVRLTKGDDLSVYRSGLLTIQEVCPVGEMIVRRFGDTAIVCLTAKLAGKYDGRAFAGTFAYSRVWHREDGNWQVEAAHASAIASSV